MKKRRLLSLLLVLCMICSMQSVQTMAATRDDVTGTWTQSSFERLSKKGVVKSTLGKYYPKKNITRAEVARIFDNLMDYQTASKNTYKDLKKGAWSTNVMLKNNAAGIFSGTKSKRMNPDSEITRQAFYVTFARLLKIPGSKVSAGFSDQKKIASWAESKINGLAKAGLLKGHKNKDGTRSVNPTGKITRGEVIVLVDRAFPGIFNEEKTYTENITGNAVVNTPQATLSNMTISKDLFIAPGVSNGETTLNNVKVSGRTFIYGGGEHSIIVSGDSDLGEMIAKKNKKESPVTIRLSGKANIDSLLIKKGSAKVNIIVNEGTTVGEIIAANEGSVISGTGNVKIIRITANNVTVNIPGVQVIISEGVTGTIIGGKEVAGGTTITTTKDMIDNEGGGGIPNPNPDPEEPTPPVEPTTPPKEGYKVTFHTNGGDPLEEVIVSFGGKLDPVPQPKCKEKIFLGWYTDSALTKQFYASEALKGDITLYAKYTPLEKQQEKKVDSFTLSEQTPGKIFVILAPGLNADQVKNAITVTNVGAGEATILKVVDKGAGIFEVSGEGGFREGSAITLTLGDGLTFSGMDKEIRNVSFTIAKKEVNGMKLDGDIVDIQTTNITNFDPIKDDGKDKDGTFIYKDSVQAPTVGTVIALYDITKPQARLLNVEYPGDDITYAKVTAVDPATKKVTYENPESKEVLQMPESLPMDTEDLGNYTKEGTSFTVPTNTLKEYWKEYDHIGLSKETTLGVGDTLVLIGGDKTTETSSDVVYGTVKTVTESSGTTTVTYEHTTLEAIMGNTQSMYDTTNLDPEPIIKKLKQARVPEQIKKQALDSGFAEEALVYLASVAAKTDGFQDAAGVENVTAVDKDGNPVDPKVLSQAINAGRMNANLGGVKIDVDITKAMKEFDGKGFHVKLTVAGDYTIKINDGATIVIKLSATFIEEIKINLNVDGGIDWQIAGIIPYPADIYMNTNVDVFNYTGIAFNVTVSSKSVDTGLDLTDIDISGEIEKLLDSKTDEELKVGTEKLFNLYGKMLENETDFISIVDQELFNTKGSFDPFYVTAYGIGMNFVINADINLSLGSSLEYKCGNRYNFWFRVVSGQSGNSTTQLIDEEMAFQFYVMGELGLRVGLKIDFAVGFFDTDLASIGIVAETGAYTQLNGYFIYEIKSLNKVVDSKMSGALYIEFGIYLDLSFKAQAGKEKVVYQPMLYEKEWPLLTAGEKINVYEFAYEKPKPEEKYIIKNFTEDYLPDSYWNMAGLDLLNGDLVNIIYPRDRFAYTLSNQAFAFDESTGKIKVTVPTDVRYMECDMTITWKGGELSFSTKELSRTLHLVWTNLADEELSIRHNIRVVSEGKTIWSTTVGEGVVPVLPTKEELKVLLDYGTFTQGSSFFKQDLRYENMGILDYREAVRPADRDQVYHLDMKTREYTVTVKNVQKEDGTKEDIVLTAKFGELFDLSKLETSGTRNPSAASPAACYTKYYRTVSTGAAVNVKPINSRIDADFARALLNGANTYEAEYTNNYVVATYKFIDGRGRFLGEATKQVEKDTYSDFDYHTFTTNLNGKSYMVKRWNKEMGKMTSDDTFIATCVLTAGAALKKLTFASGSAITVGSAVVSGPSVIVPPMDRYNGEYLTLPRPAADGYIFGGWFMDEELTKPYTGTAMGNEDLTLYPKWTAKTYLVHFDENAEEACVSGTPADQTVTFGTTYVALRTLNRSGYKFLGWFTEAVGGILADKVLTSKDHTLYAHWELKKEIPADYFELKPQSYDYNRKEQAFKLIVKGTPIESLKETEKEFMVSHKTSLYPPNKWLTTPPIDCDKYAVMIYRPETEEYQMYKKVVTDGLLLNRIDRDPSKCKITLPTKITGRTYNNITVDSATAKGEDVGDGTLKYRIGRVYTNAFGEKKESYSSWSDSRTLYPEGRKADEMLFQEYRLYTMLDGGRNYHDYETKTNNVPQFLKLTDLELSSKKEQGSMTVNLATLTGKGLDDYTDSNVYFKLLNRKGE
ncbi:MAG: InlB B-repeat-containing protein, partial [Acetivibrio sp.]